MGKWKNGDVDVLVGPRETVRGRGPAAIVAPTY